MPALAYVVVGAAVSVAVLDKRAGVTGSMTDDNRREILAQLSALATAYHYQPRR